MTSINTLDTKIDEVRDWLTKEFSAVRSGRASVALLDSVRVDSYGSKVPLNQVGNITVEDARTIRVVPWDTSLIAEIEKGVERADLGVSSSSDEKGVRIAFPALTEETRGNIIKIAKGKLEQGRISLRSLRDDVWGEIQNQEKNGDISEDEKFRLKEEMEKKIKKAQDDFDALYAKKEAEIAG